MPKIRAFLLRYTLGVIALISAYAKWGESQAKNDGDLALLILGPVFVLGWVIWSLPEWFGKTVLFVLAAPVIWVVGVAVFVLIRERVRRNGK